MDSTDYGRMASPTHPDGTKEIVYPTCGDISCGSRAGYHQCDLSMQVKASSMYIYMDILLYICVVTFEDILVSLKLNKFSI